MNILNQYFEIHEALANDNLGEARYRAAALAALSRSKANELPPKLAEEAQNIADAAAVTDAVAAREGFKTVSQLLIDHIHENKFTGYIEVYCPIQKASWLQQGREIRNPYMGKSMPTCGQIIEPVTGGDHERVEER